MDAPTPDYLTYQIDDRFDGRVVDKYQAEFGNAKDLQQIQREWRFFTPALLYLFGRFDDEPIARFYDEIREVMPIAYHRFDRALFSGMRTPLGNSDWDHVLWAVPAERWDQFEQYLISLLVVDHNSKTTYGVGAQDVEIFDPVFADKNSLLPLIIPMIRVVVLGVNGSRSCIAMDTAQKDAMECPKVKSYPPEDHAKKRAAAVFRGANPTAVNDNEVNNGET